MYKSAHDAIRANPDPAPKKAKKEGGEPPKRWTAKRSTRLEREKRIANKKHYLLRLKEQQEAA